MSGQAIKPAGKSAAKRAMPPVALAALGVVFGDIGTSPLYAFQTVFSGPYGIQADPDHIFGVLSLIFWTITLIVSVKYVLIVMRADNDGEGGIMALTALTMLTKLKNHRAKALLIGLGVLGAALFYGDSMITPAISVLSAVEGLEVAAPGMSVLVIPIALVVLTALFGMQRFGTGVVGKFFGPIMMLWFIAIAAAGVGSIVQSPDVLQAISPTWAMWFIIEDPLLAFLSLGAVILCVTGAEALYADMGHFGRGPIRMSWFVVVTGALYLNYLGQGALVIRDPANVSSPFYGLFPSITQIPMVLLATVATVIASQAVISGAFSLTQQAINLRFLPRMRIRHTSAATIGQVYVPFVNWFLFVAVVALVLGFQDSSNLAAAYGLAVSGTFVITTILISVVARRRWHVNLWILFPVTGFFLVIDTAFLAANLLKLPHGGWFPVLVAIIIFTIFTTWARGRILLHRKTADLAMTPEQIEELADRTDLARTPGTSVFLSPNSQVSMAFGARVRKLHEISQDTILVSLIPSHVPVVSGPAWLTVTQLSPGVRKVDVRYGYMQPIWNNHDLRLAKDRGVDFTGDVTFVVHSVRVEPVKGRGMAIWRKHMFAFMLQNARDPARYFRLPKDKTVEFTSVVEI